MIALAAALVLAVPPGWRAIPPDNRELSFCGSMPGPSLFELRRQGSLVFAAMDVAGSTGTGYMTSVAAERLRLPDPVDGELLHRLGQMVAEKLAPASGYRVVAQRLLDFDGADVGLLESEMTDAEGRPVVQLAYVLPGEDGPVLAVYKTTPDRLGTYRPIFDAAARATRGLVRTRPAGVPAPSLPLYVAMGFLVLALTRARSGASSRYPSA